MPERPKKRACEDADLAKSESMLRRAEKAARIGCWELDLSTGVMVCSQGALEALGLVECDELLNRLLDAALPEYRPMIRGALDDLIAGIAPFAIDFKIRRPRDGRIAYLHSTAERDRASRTVFGIIQDITIRKAAEADLADSEGRYRSLFQDNSSPMLLIDPADGRIVDANSAAAEFYGWSRRKLRSMCIQEVNTLSKDEVEAEMRAASEARRNRFDFKHRRADGSVRDVEVYSGPITIAGESLLYSIIHDVTEARRARAENERLLAEKELLLREVHHRIKNNMVAIDGMLALQAETLTDGAAKSAIEDARSRLLGMMGIYDKLYRSADFRTVDAREYFKELMEEIRANFGRDRPIEFETRVESISMDARTLVPLAIIVNELVINSLKYAFPDGRKGRVTISVSRAEDGTVSASVSDDGTGFAPREDRGGFGLVLVKALATQLRATMESKTEGGSCFRLVFRI